VEYATDTNGKRIRPALTLLAAQATGGCTAEHLDLAVIVELIHLASLIHDDVLDNAQLRRAKPTVNSKWGAELSVLLGDCLFAHALKLCSRFDDNMVCRLVAAAANEVCTGEILQTQRRFDLKLSAADYFRIVSMKTGALFRVSTELAAYLNGRPAAVVEAYRIYGDSIGVAYQIYDDCLDLFGSEDGSGKTLGTDLKKGKLTLPLLHVLQQLDGARLAAVSETILHGSDDDRAALKALVVEMGGHIRSEEHTAELQSPEAISYVVAVPARPPNAAGNGGAT
jgi:octaprenyl-diphosphate synthase